MRRSPRILIVLSVIAICLTGPSILAQWIVNGVPVCTDPSYQNNVEAVEDGAGGAIVTWNDNRGGYDDIYAQRIDERGNVQWTVDGMLICSATEGQYEPDITSDGAGGAIIAWYDWRNHMHADIYALRVNSSGSGLWADDGVSVCTASGGQYGPRTAPDGYGGAFIVWRDTRNYNSDLYAQRMSATGFASWPENGIQVCTVAGNQTDHRIIPDGAGGAIIAWSDQRSDNMDIYAQRINSSGAVMWTVDGVAICTASDDQSAVTLASDGSGGAILAWEDGRDGIIASDIYAQRVNGSGSVQWAAGGIPISNSMLDASAPQMISDGSGGAYLTWCEDWAGSEYGIVAVRLDGSGNQSWGEFVSLIEGTMMQVRIVPDEADGAVVVWRDSRGGQYHVSAQRFDPSGMMLWTDNGVVLGTRNNEQQELFAAADGKSGAIAVWQDNSSDIYAMSVDSEGRVGHYPPVISSVEDVPGDNGGWLRLTIERACWDDASWSPTITETYTVWHRIDDPVLLAQINGSPRPDPDSDPYTVLNGRRFLRSPGLPGAESFPAGTWEILGSFPAFQQDEYIYRASTLADLTIDSPDPPYSVYIVSAHTTDPLEWCLSEPDSGCSVDNLAPCTPTGLAGVQSYEPEGLDLSWTPNADDDLGGYRIYRGSGEEFVPDLDNLLETTCDPEYFDANWRWSSGYCYKISAVDIHGNESGHVLLCAGQITGDDPMPVPDATFLAQNYPNPFNPHTTIAFGLKAGGFVNLSVYDATGRLVAVLINESRPAGQYTTVWNGKSQNGSPAASGVYFYKLSAGEFTKTRKMVLLR